MELRLLGPMALVRDGRPVALPASRKTRALLAYLAVSGRPERRERLCQLFWEMPDDPKGALRWSLSKLRGLIGEALVADRETARLELAGLEVDWHVLRAAPRVLARASPAELDRLAHRRGEFLEGLELANCDSFSAWVIAQRGDVRSWQAAVFAELTGRDLPPDDLLPHARAWTELDPACADAAATLVRLLDAAGRGGEAEQQRGLSIRRLQDGGTHVPTGLRMSAPERAEAAAEPLVQHVRFCSASDGTRLAYSMVGDGPPLVKAANWLNHLEFDFDSPVWRHWIAGFSDARCFLRYDERGNGLSDWYAPLSFEAFVDDLESVVDAAGLDRFDMLGISQGASVAIAYAVRHPHRVRRLLIYGGYAMGWRMRATPAEVARRQAMLDLTREGWGLDNPAFRQMFTSLFLPHSTLEQQAWFNELQRMTTSPENAEMLQRVLSRIDVRALLGKVTAPTLVAHSTTDSVVPFEAGRGIAARIPGARFMAIDSPNHLLMEEEPGWARFLAAAKEFLA
ncbi:MAG TPA: alpha/beta fold hydrolase [Allosphingosinicella sp.]|nr:alpha/beta fold hydrolase [Allosphingosinicella sp.]